MRYKEGDEVIVKCKKSISCLYGLNEDMKKLCNTKVNIDSVNNRRYEILEDKIRWSWDDDCFIGKVGEIELQPYIGVICENSEQIYAVLKNLGHLPNNSQDACNATEGVFLIDVDSYELKDIQYRSDYYTFVSFNDLQKMHDEDELRKSNSCKYLYNELNHCGEYDICKICGL